MLSALLLGWGLVACGALDEAPEASVKAQYEAARSQTGRDPEAQVKLALWCEAHGLQAERLKHLARAVLIDPSNAAGRGLLGLVSFAGRWERPDAVSQKVKADAQLATALAEYNARREKLENTADAHWKLGLWCAENTLDAEASAHFAMVVRLDPGREAAWKRLGYKKHNGRWVTEGQLVAEKQEAEAQKAADRHWKPLVAKWRGWLGEASKRAEARAELTKLADPRAVPSVWQTFATGDAASQQIAVQVLGQIDARGASRALAMLSIFGKSADVRRAATETLKQRDPREFADLLISLLRDPIKYEVRPVGGPGSPGALFVEGKQVNVQRLYAPPRAPDFSWLWGQPVTSDIFGLPVVWLTGIPRQQVRTSGERFGIPLDQYRNFQLVNGDPRLVQEKQDFDANLRRNYVQFLQSHPRTNALRMSYPEAFDKAAYVGIEHTVRTTQQVVPEVGIPVGEIMLEYQKSAIVSQQQLAADTAALDAENTRIKSLNRRVADVLNDVSGQDLGTSVAAWKEWWTNTQGYAYYPQQDPQKPTVVQNVPLAYVPQPMPISRVNAPVGPQTTTDSWSIGFRSTMPSCFGAGTLVRTMEGPRPIESIAIGDRVLTQNIKSGALGYQPVLVVHHNPPSPTFLIKVGGETIVSSPIHRFWVAGRGWVMARSLKAGDRLRMLEGVADIESVESGPVQLVFNLDVATDHDFFAGSAGALVHDNTLPELRLTPFDAPTDVALAAPGNP